MNRYVVMAALSASAFGAAAQQVPAARADDPGAAVPQFSYRSAFEGYAGYREAPPRAWRDVNDEVKRVGGHAGIFRPSGHAGQGAQAKPNPLEPRTDKPAAASAPAVRAPLGAAPKASAHEHKGGH